MNVYADGTPGADRTAAQALALLLGGKTLAIRNRT
jgi:hypothetical protein